MTSLLCNRRVNTAVELGPMGGLQLIECSNWHTGLRLTSPKSYTMYTQTLGSRGRRLPVPNVNDEDNNL